MKPLKRRVLLTNFHPSGGGGHNTYILALIRVNERKNFEIGVAAPETSFVFKALKRKGYPFLYANDFPAKIQKEPIDVFKAISKFRKTINTFKPSIVHCNGGADLTIVNLSFPFSKPYKIIRTHHATKAIRNDFYHRWIYTRVVDHNIFVSKSSFVFSTVGGITPSQSKVIQNGVDLQYYKPAETDPILLNQYNLGKSICFGSCGGLGPYKRVDLLLHAASKIMYQYEFSIIVIGGGAHGKKLEQLAIDLGVKNFYYAGYYEDVRPIISLFDVGFILSDRIETISFAAREMLAMGKPILSSSFSGLKENVQEGFNGHLVEPGNIDAVVEAMKKFLEMDKQKLKNLSINARTFAEEHCDIKTQIDKHCSIYESVENH